MARSSDSVNRLRAELENIYTWASTTDRDDCQAFYPEFPVLIQLVERLLDENPLQQQASNPKNT